MDITLEGGGNIIPHTMESEPRNGPLQPHRPAADLGLTQDQWSPYLFHPHGKLPTPLLGVTENPMVAPGASGPQLRSLP